MYNLYTYEKDQAIKKSIKLEAERAKKLRTKRKIELNKLTTNYEKRMNNFIINLCHHPIIIKDYTTMKTPQSMKINNNKKKYRVFNIGGFMTDKNGLQSIDKEKSLNKKYEDKIIEEQKKNNIEKEKIDPHILNQPRMRFKPRNELERISEVMNLLGKDKNNKKIKKLLEEIRQIDLDRLKQLEGYGKLKLLYKQKLISSKEEQKKKDKNKDKDNEDDSSVEENKELDLDSTLEINLHRKLRNINLQLEKQKKLRNKKLNGEYDGIIVEKNLENLIKSKIKELLDLFKDDEKLYFKGASQYVMNLIDDKNQYYNKIDIKNQKFRATSAIPFYYKENKLSNYNSKLSRNVNNKKYLKKNESYKNERPISMRIINNEENNKNNKFKKYLKDDSIKKLGIKYQIKKRKMDEIINKEINNSILKKFFNDLNKKQYNKIINEPYFLEKNSILLQKRTKTVEPDIENKLAYLKRLIKFETEEKNQKTIFKQRNKNFRKNIRKDNDDNEVIIDGKKFKENDIKNIADAIFTKCGYYHKKII